MFFKNSNSDSSAKIANPKLKVGDYDAFVTFADYHPEYTSGSAFLFCYQLTDTSGRKFPFKETFLNSSRNERTVAFFEYLEKNGIDVENFRSFCGCKEKVTLKKNATTKGTFLTIAERQFIEHAKEE